MIKDQKAFLSEGKFYKGNLHSHTTNSDGKLSCAESVKMFKEHGYSFLCFSEHDYYTDYRSEFDCEDFIILPGIEASVILLEENSERRLKVHHIHGILGTEEMVKKAGDKAFKNNERVAPKILRGSWDGQWEADRLCGYLRERGCITMYNHPVWSRVEPEEFINTNGLWALEIFNYDTVNESNTGYDSVSWDLFLRRGTRINATATDDNHNEGLFDDSCGGWIMVKAEELSHEAIVKNMIEGNYYSSSGPEIYSWEIKDGVARVECSDVYRIDFFVGNHVNDGRAVLSGDFEKTISSAEYRLKGDEDYIRVQCTDKYGRTAWSNPFYED